MSKTPTNNLVIISDIHSGCRLGLYPIGAKVTLDEGTGYIPSVIQEKMWGFWREFWDSWVPKVTKGEPFDLVHNGDALNGRPHQSISNITDNPIDQKRIATAIFKPILELPNCRHFYMTRGTEAHGGKSLHAEEELAETLGTVPNEYGQYARYELWKKVGPALCHILHHIGTTGRAAYESSAPQAELVAEFATAGRWHETPPDFVVRSHRHRFIETTNPSKLGMAKSFVTPGWQAKTPFVYRIPGGRVEPPQFGGALIRRGDEDTFSRYKVWTLRRSRVEV